MTRYRAIALDVCGVLTTEKSVWQFLHERLGLWHGNAERYQEDFLSGRISYRQFCEKDALLWRGKTLREMEGIVSEIPYRSGIGDLFSLIEKRRLVPGLVSTGLSILTDRIAHEFSIPFSIANRLLAREGFLTGEVEICVGHDGKGEALDSFARSLGVSPREIIAVGDGESDIPMFEAAGFSIGMGERMRDYENKLHAVIGNDIAELVGALRRIL